MASEPHNAARGPLTISIRSTNSGAIFCIFVDPKLAELIRTPLSNTNV